ncbi:MAG: hypothetical protein WCO79_01685 [bacterium]
MKQGHPCLTALEQAIINLRNRMNYYRRRPVRRMIVNLRRACKVVSNVLRFVVDDYDGHLSRTLLKSAVSALADASRVLEKCKPIRHGLNMHWFVKVCEAIASYYREFEVLLGDGRVAYREMTADVALGQIPRVVPMH